MEESELRLLDVARLATQILKYLIRYPFTLRRKIFWSGKPQSWFGLTDHPLDLHGGQISDPFSALKKLFARRAECVLAVEFTGREGNSFLFRAKTYNVYLLRGTNLSAGAHRYLVTKRTPFRERALRLDILRPDAYRLRLARGGSVPEHSTEMVVGDITVDADVAFQDMEDKYRLSTSALILDLFKEGFRMEIWRIDSSLITESGGQTRNEWGLAMDSWPLGFLYDRHTRRTYGVGSFLLQPGEAIYGLGEKFSALDRVGQNIGDLELRGHRQHQLAGVQARSILPEHPWIRDIRQREQAHPVLGGNAGGLQDRPGRGIRSHRLLLFLRHPQGNTRGLHQPYRQTPRASQMVLRDLDESCQLPQPGGGLGNRFQAPLHALSL